MINTDKEFQKAMSDLGIASNYLGDGQYDGIYGKTCYKLWQACQQLNDKRIADLLALVAKKDEALQIAVEYQQEACQYFHDAMAGYKEHEHQRYRDDLKETQEAIALTVDDVELVEIKSYQDMINNSVNLYTIKQKQKP